MSYLPTGFSSLDALLGGGIPRGAILLLHGPRGVGLSTLAMQVAEHIAARGPRVCFLSGEESASELAALWQRLGGGAGAPEVIGDASGIILDTYTDTRGAAADVRVIDSLQTALAADEALDFGTMIAIQRVVEAARVMASRGTAMILLMHESSNVKGHGDRVDLGGGVAAWAQPAALYDAVDVALSVEPVADQRIITVMHGPKQGDAAALAFTDGSFRALKGR